MNAELPHISVVVPALNAADCLPRCLESLRALDYPKERLEIIVADNGSSDGTKLIAEDAGARVLVETKPGACCARNRGWRQARYDIIAFTDADCVVRRDWLKRLAPRFFEEKTGGVGGRLDPAPPRTVVEEYVIEKNILSQERAMRDEAVSPPFIITANAAYRKAALDEVGGFDEDFAVAGEDADLSWRVRWAGWEIVYEPAAVAVHHHRSSLSGMLKQVRSYGSGASRLFHKHGRRLGYDRFINRHVYYELIASFFKSPFALAFGKTRLDRARPALDFLGAAWYLRGKLGTSLKLGARFY